MSNYLASLLEDITLLGQKVCNLVQLYPTMHAGCCEHQGVQQRGYRLILWDTWCWEASPWHDRPDCGRHQDL
jgi:hypothetical protein